MLPSLPQVIVIDDHFEEVKNLLFAFWRMQVPCLYLDGSKANLPKKPLTGARFLFLDIELSETKGASEKDMASALAIRVQKVVGDAPGPFFICFWTNHPSVIEKVIKYLAEANLSPVGYLNLEKPINLEDETVDDLLKKINDKAESIGGFNYVIGLEQQSQGAVHKFTNDFATLGKARGDINEWSELMGKVLGSLALSYSGSKTLGAEGNDDLVGATLMLGNGYLDSLRLSLEDSKDLPVITLDSSPLDAETIAFINGKLFLSSTLMRHIGLGYVFIENDPTMYESLKTEILRKISEPSTTRLCGIVVTPPCDVANKKYLKTDGDSKAFHRVVYGLLIEYPEGTKNMEEIVKKGDWSFHIQPFSNPISKKTEVIVFHFGTVSSKWISDKSPPEYLFSIREQLAFDIQTKLANHTNRLGNNMLKL